MSDLEGPVHAHVMRSFVERGHAPDTSELAESLGVEHARIVDTLRALHAGHGLVLHPELPAIWIAHPFATAPTGVTVTAGSRSWWAPCLWCAAGVIALVGELPDPVLVHTHWIGEHEPLVIATDMQVDPLVHFPYPPRDAWSNVAHWCSTVQPFRGEPDLAPWCARHRMPRGELVPWSQVLALGRAWYGGHLDPTWRKWTAREASAIFQSVGLSAPFWWVPESDDRF